MENGERHSSIPEGNAAVMVKMPLSKGKKSS